MCRSKSLTKKYETALNLCLWLKKVPGYHSHTAMHAAGFEYTNNGDAARCCQCNLEVSNWAPDTKPFMIHQQRSPTCPYVLSMLPSSTTSPLFPNNRVIESLVRTDKEPPSKKLKTNQTDTKSRGNTLIEINTIKEIRKRSFSHWSQQASPSAAKMIEAGFFCCNVGDRVICIYCNLICHKWTSNSTDDPCKVHKTLSSQCPYVTDILTASQTATSHMEKKCANIKSESTSFDKVQEPLNPKYSEPKTRLASFNTWNSDNRPCTDNLVRAGFFYTGMKTTVTCFYCNGSLQDLGTNDNPVIEHVRWFPHCGYARQLCGPELYQRIQELTIAQNENVGIHNSKVTLATRDNHLNHNRLELNEDDLENSVTARLDLPISRCLINHEPKPSIIKKCWVDQLQLKGEEFANSSDLLMAYNIVEKQIQSFNGQKANIIVPSVEMKNFLDQQRENAQSDARTEKPSPKNPCVLCLNEEKSLVCLPCCHLITCATCCQVYRFCPICYNAIDAFVRVYV